METGSANSQTCQWISVIDGAVLWLEVPNG